MDVHKNEKSELRLWAKDGHLPGDLQELCKQAATSINKLQERNKELEAEIIQLKTQMFPNEYEQNVIEAMDEGKYQKG